METTKKRKIPVISPILNFFVNFHKRFMDGSIGTKLSHFIMGAGNFYHKQYIKGAIYLLLQVLFVLVMVLCPGVKTAVPEIPGMEGMFEGESNITHFGYKSLVELFGNGENHALGYERGEWPFGYADNSMLILLFGVITIGMIFVYIFAWNSSIKSAYKADLDVRSNKKPTAIKEDLRALLDERFHVLMLTPTCLAALVFTVLPTIFMILIAFTDYG